MDEGRVMSASNGSATRCRPDVPACVRLPNGAQPRLFIDEVTMVGMPATVTFGFDAEGQLNQTAVMFKNADFGLISNMLQGIHGSPVAEPSGNPLVGVWRDQRRGSTITLTGTSPGATMIYRPTNSR